MGEIILLVVGVVSAVYLLVCAVITYALQAAVETTKAKRTTIATSLAIALGGPVLYFLVAIQKIESEEVAREKSKNDVINTCANTPVMPAHGHSASSYFVDIKLLDMLMNRFGSSPGFDELADFLLKSGLDSLEFIPHSNTHFPLEIKKALPTRGDDLEKNTFA